MAEDKNNETLAQLLGGTLIGSARVLGVEVRLRTLTAKETRDVLTECQTIADAPLRVDQEIFSTLARSLVQVGGNDMPDSIPERLKLIESWRQGVIDKLAVAYRELVEKERNLIDELKN